MTNENETNIVKHDAESFDGMIDSVQEEADEMLSLAPEDGEARAVAYLDWYVQKMAEVSDMQARVKSQYRVLTNQLKNRHAALTHCMGGQAQEITESLISKQGGKKRSVDTLYGRAGLRTTTGSVRVTDESAYFEWLDSQPVSVSGLLDDCIERKVVRTSPIKTFIEDTGEVPPGVSYVPAHDKFYPAADSRRMEASKDG